MGQGRAGEGEFFALLADLREFRAGPLNGDPSDRALARAAGVSPTTISSWLSGRRFPQDMERFLPVVHAVAARAAARGLTGVDRGLAVLLNEEHWRAAYRQEAARRADAVAQAVEGAHAARALAPSTAGRLLTEVSDPFALEVHRPVRHEDAGPGLPVLPGYVPRDHDHQLAEVVRAAAGGSSGIAVLVGGSSTGKTRACWEALALLRNLPEPWRLWHPIDPSRPEAALRELPSIGPYTVIWLNDAQFYLEAPDDAVGERVAAGLRELLRDPGRAPVLVLATLWLQFWDALTARPPAGEADPHAQARELLSGRDISVPTAFTPAQLRQITGAEDPRLALAATAALDGQVIQFLAGAPELLARYEYAPSAAKALITAAIDARRLGMGVALPLAFLEAVTPGYLTESEWDGLGDDWLEQALAYTAAECQGTRGPLTRIRPRPAKTGAAASGPAYRLADYLDQHGRRSRRSLIPPAEFWTAAADLTDPGDLSALARAAEGCGLLYDATRLGKAAGAAARGSGIAAADLITSLYSMRRAGNTPPRWITAYATSDDPYATARVLSALREAGADDQVETLLARNPAGHVPLDDPYATARLLSALRAVGAADQVETLLARSPAAHAPLGNPYATARLLSALRQAGADDQVETLLARNPAGHAPLGNPYATARLLDALREAGADDQVETLLARSPAANAPLGDSVATAWLLNALRAAGAADQVEVLLARSPAAHVSVGNPQATAWLLNALRAVGAADQVTALAARAIDKTSLRNPQATAQLLNALRAAGAADQVGILLARNPAAHASLRNPHGVAWLLNALRAAGAADQVEVLLACNPAAHASLGNPHGTAWLLKALRAVGAAEQVTALAARAAGNTPLSNPQGTAQLLRALQDAGAVDQVDAFLARNPAAHASLDNPDSTVQLLNALQEAGAADQVDALLARDPAVQASLSNPHATARLLNALRDAGAVDQVDAFLARDPAANASLRSPYGTAWLLQALHAAGAAGQVTALAARAAGNTPSVTRMASPGC